LVGDDPKRKRDDLIFAAHLYRDRLADLGKSIAAYRTCEERFGRNNETIDALSELLNQAEDYAALVELLNDAIPEESDAIRATSQLTLLGDTLRVHVLDRALALSAYARSLSLDCNNSGARAGLVALLEEKELAHQAGEHLVRAYRTAQEDEQVVGLAERRIESAPSLAFKSEILLEVARIQERRQDLAAALTALRRAFALVPSADTESELHRVAGLTKQWSVVEQAYAEAIVQCQDATRLCSLYLMKGNTERLHLTDFTAATASYAAALEQEPTRADIARLLIDSAHQAKLYAQAAWAIIENSRKNDAVSGDLLDTFAQCAQAHGDWDGVLEGMADRIANAGEMSARVAHDIKKQLAIWYRDEINDPDSAELVLKRAVSDLPERDTVAMLAELQRRSPSRALVATLCLLSEKSQNDLIVLREAAEVALGPVADAELARPILERALEGSAERLLSVGSSSDPSLAEINDWCTDRLVELSLSQRDFARGVQLLEGAAALPFSSARQIDRLYQAASVARDGALDAQAVALCEQVLARESSHEAAITLLSALHAEAGRLEQLLSLRKRELALDRPLERRLFLRLDQARVLGELDKPADQRLVVLRENLIDRPGHAETIEALDTILTELADFSALVRLYEEQADAVSATAAEHAARLWERAGLLSEQHLSDEARLAAAFKKSAALLPSIFVVDRLAQLAHAHDKWEEEVSWLTLRLSLTAPAKDAPDRRAVVVALGQALVKTDEWTIAAATLEQELSADPAADEARQLLARIYRELGEWEKLGELLELGVGFAPDDATRVSYLRDAAVVHRKHLDQTEAAIPLLEEAIALDHVDRGLKLMLADTLRTCGRYEEGREILRGMLEEFGRRRTRERAMVHMQLARIAEALGELDEAVEQADAAANIERSDAAILMLVGRLARRKGELDRAEKAYRTLALLAGRRSAQSAVQSLEEVGESAILFELHRIASEKGEAQQARELLDSAISVATRDESEALRLANSLAQSDQLDLLFAALQLGIDNGIKGEAAAHLLLIKANVLEQCERGHEAFAARLQALTEAPSDLRLLDGTQKLAERLGLSGDLWRHVTSLALRTASQPSVAGELWFRAGQAAEAEGELGRAAECYEHSQQSGFKPRRAFQALDTVLDEASEPERVRRALSVFIQAQGAEANAGVYAEALYRLADMELGHAQVDIATELLLRAIEIDSQAERVVAMLEPTVRDGIASPKVVRLFLAVCKKAANDGLQLYAYKQALALHGIEPSVTTEAIALARRLDEKAELRAFISRAIEVAPVGDVGIADLLVERAGMAKADGELALEAGLLERATAYFEGKTLSELKLRLAASYGEQDLPQKALTILEELFEAAPGEGRIWRPLLAIYRATNATAKIEQVIELIADQVTDAADLEALKVERVRLMVRDGRAREAEAELRAVLDKHPQMSDAAGLLVEILRDEQRSDELLDVLRTLLEQARRLGHPKLIAQYGLELARLIEPTDRGEAINLLVADLEQTKSEHDLLAYLLTLYGDEDNQGERADIMEHLIGVSPAKVVKERTLRLVELRTRLDDSFGAGRALEIGVRVAPGDAELVGLLIDHLRDTGEHGALAEALLVKAKQMSAEQAAQCYVEAANIFEAYLGDPARAAEAYQAAFAADPSSVAHLLKAVELLVSCGEIDVALSKLGSAIERCQEFMLVDLLQLRATILAREKSGDRLAMVQAASDLAR
ncbi:MAG TPA: tetratricopeptide repeat protein, partial [Polyangiaceae bacterium]|nr:tetratricopeptide repeat protein [Polyangiaceae bacterium]